MKPEPSYEVEYSMLDMGYRIRIGGNPVYDADTGRVFLLHEQLLRSRDELEHEVNSIKRLIKHTTGLEVADEWL